MLRVGRRNAEWNPPGPAGPLRAQTGPTRMIPAGARRRGPPPLRRNGAVRIIAPASACTATLLFLYCYSSIFVRGGRCRGAEGPLQEPKRESCPGGLPKPDNVIAGGVSGGRG